MTRHNNLNLIHPSLRERIQEGLILTKKENIPLYPFETFRSFSRQTYLYKKGRENPGPIVTNAKAGRSWHNYGLAVDLVLKINGCWSWEFEEMYLKAGPIFEKCGLKWLGRGKKFRELVHYQLDCDLNINEAFEINKIDGVLSVWNKINKLLKEI